MRKIRLIVALMVLFPLLAVSVAAQRSRAPVRDYFPLRVGDSWTYLHDDGDFKFTIKVNSVEKQADGTMRYMVQKLAGAEIHEWYSKVDGWVLMHGQAYVGQEGIKVNYEPGRQYLKNPLVAGTKWTWKGKGNTGQDITESNRVIGLETLKVPAGTFRAMKIVSVVSDGDAVMTKTYWYADGVGLIKSTTEGREIKYGWELFDYSFKKPKPGK